MRLAFRRLLVAGALCAVLAAIYYGAPEFSRRRLHAAVLNSEPERLERLGRRLIVGYHDAAGVKVLVENRAIAGIFVSARNVDGRSSSEVAAEIADLQAIRRRQGLPDLIVAADQEGGPVSRLSPPLPLQPSLGSVLTASATPGEQEQAVRSYAQIQAIGLSRLGVTLNFSPVVDLKPDAADAMQGGSQIGARAIARDPGLVAKVAGWYCDALEKSGIGCTLKHFPGLGRVAADTHVAPGEIDASQQELASTDWLPFQQVMSEPGVAVMVGHVRVLSIDRETPASFSRAVIDGVLRQRWKFDGLVVTDDFGMGAVVASSEGIGGAAVKAVNSGADLILISNMEKHFDAVMSALLAAERQGLIDTTLEAQSRQRLAKAAGARPTTAH